MRYRIRTDISESGVVNEVYRPFNGTPFTVTYGPFTTHSEQDFMYDEPHPGYRKMIKNGILVIGSCDRTIESYTVGGGSFHAIHQNGDVLSFEGPSITKAIIHRNGGPLGQSLTPLATDIDVEAVKLQALAKVDAGQFDFTEDILSIRENVKMFREPLEGLHDALKHARRKRPTSSAASVWAYARFGATPFIRSIHEAYESFHASNKEVQSFVRLRSTASKDSAQSSNYNWVSGALYNKPTYAVTNAQTDTVRVGVFYKVTRPRGGLSYKYSARWKDLPAGFWNVVPYSFMIDRIYSVNNLIEATVNILDPTVQIEGAYVTVTQDYTGTVRLQDFYLDNLWSASVSGDTITKKLKTISRRRWDPRTSFPSPSVNLKGLVNDSTKILDLTALVLQRLKLKI